jgi:alcohol dehydrogenase YqhD (iron-dependent ADH family)
MENFIHYNPTKILFGKDVVDDICQEISPYGKRALLIIGKGSVKQNGIYARVISLMNICGLEHYTFEGIQSNPTFQDADAAVKLAKEKQVDMIVALGGGSVIDTAKAVAAGFYVEHSVWDFYLRKASTPKKALPIIAILTLAATGSEMNSATVLQDSENGIKTAILSDLLYPKVSFLDPTLTVSVPLNYTAYGVVDLIAHALEQFFGKGNAPLTDHYTADIIKLAMSYGRKVMVQPEDYDTRAQIMWLATNALNGTLSAGKSPGDWGVHHIEHTLSVLYDIPHGAGLSIVYPAWLKIQLPKIKEKLAFLAKHVFEFTSNDDEVLGLDFITALEAFFKEINSPISLTEAGINIKEKQRILNNLAQNKVSGMVYPLTEKDHQEIVEEMF